MVPHPKLGLKVVPETTEGLPHEKERIAQGTSKLGLKVVPETTEGPPHDKSRTAQGTSEDRVPEKSHGNHLSHGTTRLAPPGNHGSHGGQGGHGGHSSHAGHGAHSVHGAHGSHSSQRPPPLPGGHSGHGGHSRDVTPPSDDLPKQWPPLPPPPPLDGTPAEAVAVYNQAWAGFLQSLATSIDHRFRAQERLMQQCLRQLMARSDAGDSNSPTCDTLEPSPSSGSCSTVSEADEVLSAAAAEQQDWQSKLETSLQNIQTMLEKKVIPVLQSKQSWTHAPSESVATRTPQAESNKRCHDSRPCLPVGESNTELTVTSTATAKMMNLLGKWDQEEVIFPKGPSSDAAATDDAPVGGEDKDKREGRDSQGRESQKETWQLVFEDRLEEYKRLHAEKNKALVTWVEWWMKLEEPERKGCVATVVESKAFEAISAFVIVTNTVFAAVVTDNEISSILEDGAGAPPPPVLFIVEAIFLSFYAVELVLKLWVHRLYFFCATDARWNIFDLLLVITAIYYEAASASVNQKKDGLDLSYMRVLRILKLARILRVIRVAKVLSELRLMLNSIIGCVFSLFWSFVMLFLVFYIFGLIFVQGATSHLLYEPNLNAESKDALVGAFGSVGASMLTLFAATTGGTDWVDVFRSPLVEDMGQLYIWLFIFLIAFIQVALLNILTGIFVENAIKLAQPDRETLALEQRKREMREGMELRELFRVMDLDGSGGITPEELYANIKDERLNAQLRVMGLDIKDAELFYKMLLEEQDVGTVDIEDFVTGCMHMKGSASSLDIYALRLQMRTQGRRLRDLVEALDARLQQLPRVTPRKHKKAKGEKTKLALSDAQVGRPPERDSLVAML